MKLLHLITHQPTVNTDYYNFRVLASSESIQIHIRKELMSPALIKIYSSLGSVCTLICAIEMLYVFESIEHVLKLVNCRLATTDEIKKYVED